MNQIELEKVIEKLSEKDLEGITLKDIEFDTKEIVDLISSNPNFQSPFSPIYQLFKKLLIVKYAAHYEEKDSVNEILGVKINFPYISLGNINSIHFFGIDELLIYDFYLRNKNKYKVVADFGTNCGLHSKILCELGYTVDSFEPDITHSKIAKSYLENYPNNTFYQKAISSYSGKATFTRITNNSTGSFINDKKTSYGPVEKFEVDVVNAKDLSNKYDLIKMDIEGSEVDVLQAFDKSTFEKTDIIAEVSTPENRVVLWDFFKNNSIRVLSQKKGWEQVESINDLPTSHREGSIFISKEHNWVG